MTLDLTRRLVKGSPLTAADHDDNLDKLESGLLHRENNLSDLENVAEALENLGFGSALYAVQVDDSSMTGPAFKLGGDSLSLVNSPYSGIGGFLNTIENGQVSFVWGVDIELTGSYSVAFGQGHRITGIYTVTTGLGCVPPFTGSKVHASRQRLANQGSNMALDWHGSRETTNATANSIRVTGSIFPTQPPDSIVNGTIWVVGVSDAGVCSSFKIDMTSERVGSGAPVLRVNDTTTLYNGLGLGTVPTMEIATGAVYRVRIVGIASTNIRWDARFTGHQVVFT